MIVFSDLEDGWKRPIGSIPVMANKQGYWLVTITTFPVQSSCKILVFFFISSLTF